MAATVPDMLLATIAYLLAASLSLAMHRVIKKLCGCLQTCNHAPLAVSVVWTCKLFNVLEHPHARLSIASKHSYPSVSSADHAGM